MFPISTLVELFYWLASICYPSADVSLNLPVELTSIFAVFWKLIPFAFETISGDINLDPELVANVFFVRGRVAYKTFLESDEGFYWP